MDNQVQQGPKQPTEPWTTINSLDDLIAFLNGVHLSLKQWEVHAEYEPKNYRLVTQAKVVDDNVILKLDIAESDPFEHDE